MKRGPNTRQKKATTRRLAAQKSLGLPIISKLVILASGLLKHPTKKRPTVKGVEVRQAPSPARRWQDPVKMKLLNQMSNRQITAWQRAGRPGLNQHGRVDDADQIRQFFDFNVAIRLERVRQEKREKQNA